MVSDVMMQNKVRHLLVLENYDRNRPLGIITATDFVAYLKENLNIDDVNAKILAIIHEQSQNRVLNVLDAVALSLSPQANTSLS
jgi:signal-transduction protein with cAMP-binding, CBS, and nucleotidyltransferase domain